MKTLAFMLIPATAVAAQVAQPPGLARRALDVDRTIDLLLDEDQVSPAALTLPERRYRFVLHNSFTGSRLDLRLDDDKNLRVSQVEVKALASRGELIVELKKGKHAIYIAQRPKWRTAIDERLASPFGQPAESRIGEAAKVFRLTVRSVSR